jgi:hypothetical protein
MYFASNVTNSQKSMKLCMETDFKWGMWLSLFVVGYFAFLFVWAWDLTSATTTVSTATFSNVKYDFVYSDDSCHGTVLLCWLLFSLYSWLSRTSNNLDDEDEAGSVAELEQLVVASSRPQKGHYNPNNGQGNVVKGVPYNPNLPPHDAGRLASSAASKIMPMNALVLHNEVLTDHGMMDFFGGGHLKEMRPSFWNPCLVQHRAGLLELFLYPLAICIAISHTSKFSVDIDVQGHIFAGLMFSFLQYC